MHINSHKLNQRKEKQREGLWRNRKMIDMVKVTFTNQDQEEKVDTTVGNIRQLERDRN